MQNHKFGLLLNPASGKIKKQIDHIRNSLSAIPGLIIREPSSPSEFISALENFSDIKITHLIIFGGDGTVQSALSYWLNNFPKHKLPNIILIPGGTTNMTATDLGIRGINKSLNFLTAFINDEISGKLINRSLIKLVTQDGHIHYGFFFGMGAIASTVNYFNQHVKKSGVTGELISAVAAAPYLLKLFFSPNDNELRQSIGGLIIDDEHRNETNVTVLFATTLDRLLFGLKPYWGVNLSPLHVTLIKSSAKQLWRSLYKIITNRGVHLKEKDGYISKDSKCLDLSFKGYYIIDGEIFHLQDINTIKISASPPVTFIVP